jgi:TolB-like protein
MSRSPVLQEARDRRLGRWVLAYLASAWALVEATSLVAEQFHWPQAVERSVTVLAFFGFFVTLILAWFHGGRGKQAVSRLELGLLASVLALAGITVAQIGIGGETREPSRMGSAPGTGREKPAIAVLPCENISPEPDSVFYSKGIHNTILLQLQRISGLRTISRTSVRRYEQDPPPITQIGSELGVGFIGECTVQKEVDRIQVIFRLIDASSDEQIWAEEYYRDLTTQDLLEINSSIASGVASRLRTAILPEERAMIERLPTHSVAAHDAYFLARHYLEDAGTGQEAVRFFQQAIRVDSTFALAFSGLAQAYDILSSTGAFDPQEGWSLAEDAAIKAIELDGTLSEPYTVLGDVYLVRWDWARAEEAFLRAIELQPGNPIAHQWYSIMLTAQGRIEEGLREAALAVEYNPRVAGSVGGLGVRLLMARRCGEALPAMADARRLGEGGGLNPFWIFWGYLLCGQPEQALAAAERVLEVSGDSIWFGGLVASNQAEQGDYDAARETLRHLELRFRDRQAEGEFVDPFVFWYPYAVIGELDSAFRWLHEAVETKSYGTVYTGVAPWSDPLRGDPRFQEVLEEIGLGHLKDRFDSLAVKSPSPSGE